MAEITIKKRNAYSGLDADKPDNANIGDTYDASDTFKKYFWNGSAWNIQDVFATLLLHVKDEKADTVSGGTFTQAAWRTRDLQTVKTNEIVGASLAANQITLPAGSYIILAKVVAYRVNGHKAKLRNITDGSDIIIGSNGFSSSTTGDVVSSVLSGKFTIADTKVLELQHQCITTGVSTGFGPPVSFGVVEVYADVMIWKTA